MARKITAGLLSVLLLLPMLCACKGTRGGTSGGSSTIASSEKYYSEVTRSGETDSANSSGKGDSTSKNASDKTSSRTISIISRTPSLPNMETESSSVKLPVNPKLTAGVGVYHFSPGWTYNYGKEENKRYEEFEDVLSAGYFNTVITSQEWAEKERFWEICLKYRVTVWVSLYSYFQSQKTTLENYIAKVDKSVSIIRQHADWWDSFNGFHFEECIWRGQSNDDFAAEAKALYQKYGKRNFVVLATGEFTGVEGNEQQINTSAENMKKIHPSSFQYMTDISFDSYSVDVRDGALNGSFIARMQKELPSIKDGKTYYIEMTRLLKRLCGRPANVWFFPCAYTTGLWGGLNGQSRADEAYCLAHLNFFDELLDAEEFPGGMFLYTYQQFSNKAELGLQSHLEVFADKTDASGEKVYKLRPDEEKWTYYSTRLKELTEKYKTTAHRLVFD